MYPRETDQPQGNAPVILEDAVNFMENPEPRCACVLLLDTSESMFVRVSLVPVEMSSYSVMDGVVVGRPTEILSDEDVVIPIEELTRGIEDYKRAVKEDPLASLRVETAIVAFDSRARVIHDFATVDQLPAAQLDPLDRMNMSWDIEDFESADWLWTRGETNIADGIDKALDLLERRKEAYRESGIAYYRPWVVLITDGKSTCSSEEMSAAADRIRQAESAKRLAFFSVGVEGADMDELNSLTPRGAMPLNGYNFREFFKWLSASMSTVSSSRIDDEINLPDVSGWAKL